MKNTNKEPKGAAEFTHALKKYGGGKSMQDGLERYGRELRQLGKQEGFVKGEEWALRKLSLPERILGRPINRK